MKTITLKINERSKIGKSFIAFIEAFSKEKKDIEIVQEESPYSPDFVEKIKKAEERGNYTEVNPNDIWGSLGLK
jgi:ABC-type glycerol-3-phosphate transport system substrate-binding protein